jgi:hypothetical protein
MARSHGVFGYYPDDLDQQWDLMPNDWNEFRTFTMVYDRSKSVRDRAFIMTQFSGQEVLVFRGTFILQGSFGKRGDESFYIPSTLL